MKKDLNYYLNLPYTISVKKLKDGDYYAEYTDANLTKNTLMAGWGKNEMEAINDLKEAFSCFVESALKDGDFIPEPNDKSVRVNICLPRSLLNAIDKVTKNRSKFLKDAANKIDELISNKNLFLRLSENARKSIEKIDIKITTKKELELLNV